jgi:hypothetical protein
MDIHFLQRAGTLRHWTFWEWVAYVALFVAALIIAADTGFRESPDVMARLPEFFHSEWWGFAPAVLVVVATTILLLREFVFSNNKLPQQATSKPSAPATATATVTKPKKVFVNVSPSYLIGLYENRTTIQGDDLAAAYIGKWMIVTGRVQDIRLKEDGTCHALIQDSDGAWIGADFTEKSSDTISHIAHNSIIKVRGEISLVNPWVILRKCELDETGPS